MVMAELLYVLEPALLSRASIQSRQVTGSRSPPSTPSLFVHSLSLDLCGRGRDGEEQAETGRGERTGVVQHKATSQLQQQLSASRASLFTLSFPPVPQDLSFQMKRFWHMTIIAIWRS